MMSGSKPKGLIARILGGQPTMLQKLFFWFMVASLLIWPLFFFGSLFIFDAPIHSTFDEVCRWGMFLTIALYPLYLIPLMRLWFLASRRIGASWFFYSCPLVPVLLFVFFAVLASSEYAKMKPEGYDSATFKRLNDAYAVDVNHAYYGNGILEGADPASFKVLSENYAADKDHVWYIMYLIDGVDPSTFVVPERKRSMIFTLPLAHDDHDYYSGQNPLHVVDMGSFLQKDHNWAIDSKNVYYLGIDVQIGENTVPIGDYDTFQVLSNSYAADSRNVYYRNAIVEGADPQTFTVLEGEQRYGQDKNRVYCEAYGSSIRDLNAMKHKNMKNGMWDAFHTDGTTVYNPQLMEMPVGTDFATIHRVERYRDWYADDKRVYYENKLLPGAQPQTFMIFPSHYVSEEHVSNNNKDHYYSCDGNFVFYRDSLMQGVDVPSFICGYDYVESQSFAFDKNRYYQGTPNPRLEKLRQGK